jgi:hypothetical protein
MILVNSIHISVDALSNNENNVNDSIVALAWHMLLWGLMMFERHYQNVI